MREFIKKATFFAFACFLTTAQADESNCRRNCDITSHTFFSVRPQFQVGSPEFTSLRRTQRTQKRNEWGGSIQATVFGGQSSSSKELGTYFAPFGSPSFTVDGTIRENNKDLLPQHFNIFGNKFSDEVIPFFLRDEPVLDPAFKSVVTLKPKQSVIGLGLAWQQGFSFSGHKFWLGISGPIINVENNMGLCERVSSNNVHTVPSLDDTNLADPQTSMRQALAQKGWCYGKIDCNKRDSTGLAFIQLQLGHVSIERKGCIFEPFIGLTIPTGDKPDGKYVFEPIVGNNDHFGLLWGGNARMKLWKCKTRKTKLTMAADITAQYLFSNTQKRSFDLHYKPWSRYIELYKNLAQAEQAFNEPNLLRSAYLATPGINTLTRDVKVEPGFNISSNFALIYEPYSSSNGFNVEAGYNFYARESECLKLKNRCSLDAAIKDHVGGGLTNSVRDMTGDILLNEANFCNLLLHGGGILDNYDRAKLSTNDFDLSSAAHPCVLSHTIYGSVGYQWATAYLPLNASVGGSYEFSGNNNAAMDRWLVWGKLGVSF